MRIYGEKSTKTIQRREGKVGMATRKVAMGMVVFKEMKDGLLGQLDMLKELSRSCSVQQVLFSLHKQNISFQPLLFASLIKYFHMFVSYFLAQLCNEGLLAEEKLFFLLLTGNHRDAALPPSGAKQISKCI